MRRLLLFVALLALTGLTTAFASSFAVETEDVASFTPDVSISIPATSKIFYLIGPNSVLPGGLELVSEETGSTTVATSSPVNSKAIEPGSLAVKLQDDEARFHSWESLAPPGGYGLMGTVMLHVFQNGNVGPLTAGLFDCPPPTPPAATTATSGCQQIAGDASSPEAANTDSEAVVDLGSLDLTILEGHTLRLQIVNLGTKKWNVQWGYKSNRPSRLDVTMAQL